MSSALEGRIDIRIAAGNGGVREVGLRSSRPQVAQKLLAGRSPAEAADLVGRIFTLCGRAQRIAAETACEAAAGVQPDAALNEMRGRKVLAELAQEHAWQLLVSWPQQAERAPDTSTMNRVREAARKPETLIATLEPILAERILGEPPAAWRKKTLPEFEVWRRENRTLPAALFAGLNPKLDAGTGSAILPPLHEWSDEDLNSLGGRALNAPGYCARPLWRDAPAETGAIARQSRNALVAEWIGARGCGAGARLLARLLELAEAATITGPAHAMVRRSALEQNTGMAGVETSRGLLFHVVRLEGGRIDQYRIVAPTEWNFHPAGPVVQALRALPADGDLEANARAVALAFDPCVEYGLEVHHA